MHRLLAKRRPRLTELSAAPPPPLGGRVPSLPGPAQHTAPQQEKRLEAQVEKKLTQSLSVRLSCWTYSFIRPPARVHVWLLSSVNFETCRVPHPSAS